MKRIILLVGPKGHGKNTFADMLHDAAKRSNVMQFAFARPLKLATQVFTGLSDKQLEDRVIKEAVHPAIGMSPRQFQIELADLIRKGNPDAFVDFLIRDLRGCLVADGSVAIITDARYPNEIEDVVAAFPDAHVSVVHIMNPWLPKPSEVHESEAMSWGFYTSSCPIEYVSNYGTLQELQAQAELIAQEYEL